jgi:hypothetical protein
MKAGIMGMQMFGHYWLLGRETERQGKRRYSVKRLLDRDVYCRMSLRGKREILLKKTSSNLILNPHPSVQHEVQEVIPLADEGRILFRILESVCFNF